MQNKASKKEAVEVIRRAVCDGWTRKINAFRYENKPWYLQVSLTKQVDFSNDICNLYSHIIVSFRKTPRRGWVNSIATRNGSKTFRGLWDANYALKQMAETTQWQAEREQKKFERKD